jgi:hypothetical protein
MESFRRQVGRGVQVLVCYVEDNGDARVPSSYVIDGFRLGEWATGQRSLHAKGDLAADRARRLQELPDWTWNTRADKWEAGFTTLLRYVEDNVYARVPQSCVFDGYPLGQWVSNQRQSRRKGTLDPDRERRLQELPDWTWEA